MRYAVMGDPDWRPLARGILPTSRESGVAEMILKMFLNSERPETYRNGFTEKNLRSHDKN